MTDAAQVALVAPAVGNLWHYKKADTGLIWYINVVQVNHRNIWTNEGTALDNGNEIHQYSRVQFLARLRIGGNKIDLRDNEPFWKVGKYRINHPDDEKPALSFYSASYDRTALFFQNALAQKKPFYEHWPA